MHLVQTTPAQKSEKPRRKIAKRFFEKKRGPT